MYVYVGSTMNGRHDKTTRRVGNVNSDRRSPPELNRSNDSRSVIRSETNSKPSSSCRAIFAALKAHVLSHARASIGSFCERWEFDYSPGKILAVCYSGEANDEAEFDITIPLHNLKVDWSATVGLSHAFPVYLEIEDEQAEIRICRPSINSEVYTSRLAIGFDTAENAKIGAQLITVAVRAAAGC